MKINYFYAKSIEEINSALLARNVDDADQIVTIIMDEKLAFKYTVFYVENEK